MHCEFLSLSWTFELHKMVFIKAASFHPYHILMVILDLEFDTAIPTQSPLKDPLCDIQEDLLAEMQYNIQCMFSLVYNKKYCVFVTLQ